jgi:hypothetical protein
LSSDRRRSKSEGGLGDGSRGRRGLLCLEWQGRGQRNCSTESMKQSEERRQRGRKGDENAPSSRERSVPFESHRRPTERRRRGLQEEGPRKRVEQENRQLGERKERNLVGRRTCSRRGESADIVPGGEAGSSIFSRLRCGERREKKGEGQLSRFLGHEGETPDARKQYSSTSPTPH